MRTTDSSRNCRAPTTERGWRGQRLAGPKGGAGDPYVERNGLRVRVRAANCRSSRDTPTVGDAVSVRRPKELRAASPGFYTALGDRKLAIGHEGLEVRVYFNVAAAGAAPLVAACTRLLNEAEIPFGQGRRSPDGVLALRQRGAVPRRRRLREGARIARGRGFRVCFPPSPGCAGIHETADARCGRGRARPSLGASFGSSRCRLVAEGILDAHERGSTGLEDRLDAVARRFARRGFDFEAPYLVPASANHNAL